MPTVTTKIAQSRAWPNIAESYGPFATLQAATTYVENADIKCAGLTVGINQPNGSIKEYWYQPDGQGGLELVEKQEAGQAGQNAYVHIKYAVSATPQAADMHSTQQAGDKYIGVYTGTASEAPSTPNNYNWAKFVGENGANGQDGQDAINPFKGWFDAVITGEAGSKVITSETANLPANPSVGDFAYVKTLDISGTAPSQTETPIVKIYACATASTWADSGRTFNPDYDQSFASGQQVNEVNVVNDFTTGGANNVASAETVKNLNENKIDKVAVVSEEITYIDIANEADYPKSGTLNTSGSEANSSTYFISKFQVSQGKQYTLGGANVTTRPVYYFYDSQDAAIPNSGLIPSNTSYNTYEDVIAPAGASFVRVIGTSGSPAYCKEKSTSVVTKNNQAIIDSVGDVSELETTEKQTVVGAINEVAGAINEMGDVSGAVEKIDAITETVVSVNMFDKSAVINGYINAATGNIASSSSSYKMSGYIPVLPNHFYYLSGRSSNGVIRCLNADKSEVMKVLAPFNSETLQSYNLPNIDATGWVANGQFKTPANAAFVQFNVIFAGGDSADSVMLTDVGDTYDSDYVVPAYQPYGTTTKVKQSAIDCDDTPIEDSEKPITSGGVYEALQNVTPGATQPLKILLIGSSHGMNTIAQLPFIASKSGIPVIVGNVYQGSMSMQWMLGGALRSNYNFSFKLWSNGSWGVTQSLPMANILKLYDWDYISIQRSASDDEVWTTTAAEVEALSSGVKDSLNINHYQDGATAEYLDHNKTLQRVIDFIKNNANNSPTILVNSNFTDSGFYSTDKTNTYIIPSIEKMKDNFGIEYYSTAIALRNARGTFLQLLGNYINGTYPEASHNLTYDGQHIDYGIGCYLLSITLLGFILKMRGIGIETLSGYGTREEMNTNWWVPMSGDNIDRYTEPNEYTMACAKACAKAALLSMSQQNDTVKARFRWSVDYNLANGVTSSNEVPFSTHQDKYETTLTGVTSQTVTVTSQSSRSANPVDITSQVYDSSTGKITINSVEGDIVITVS